MAALLRAWHQQKKLAEELACLVLKVVLIHPRTCGARLKVNNKMLPQMKVSQHHQIVVVCRKYTNFPMMLTFSGMTVGGALKHTPGRDVTLQLTSKFQISQGQEFLPLSQKRKEPRQKLHKARLPFTREIS